MSKQEKALEFYQGGRSCAQAVLLTFAEECGLSEAEAVRLAGCLGGGMGCGEVCGVLSAAMLILGLKNFDATADNPTDEKARTRKIGADFIRAFQERNQCVTCRDLLRQGGKAQCLKAIQDATELLETALR